MDPWRPEILLANVALLVLFVLDTTGDALPNDWSVMDGLYVTLPPCRQSVFAPPSPTSVGSLRAGSALGGHRPAHLRRAPLGPASRRQRSPSDRRTKRQINERSGHYIICGYGRVGERLAEDL